MGVPLLYKVLVGRSRKGVRMRNIPRNVDVLSFDLNSLLHKAAQKCWNYGEYKSEERQQYLDTNPRTERLEQEFLIILGAELTSVIVGIKPAVAVIFAIDGVAPMGKIFQQRSRRYRSALSGGQGSFDSNALTPGTKLMGKVEVYIKEWIHTNREILPPRSIFSGWRTPGEGEQKMFPLFDHASQDKGVDNHGLNIVIYGLDADIILLSLYHTHLKSLFMVREDPRNTISMSHLREELSEDMLGRPPRDILELDQTMKDFVLMSFFLGNDFLPQTPMLKNMETSILTLISVYKRTGRPLTVPTGVSGFIDIDWEALALFLTNLGEVEERSIEAITREKYKYPSPIYETANEGGTFSFSNFRALWYSQNFNFNGKQEDIEMLQLMCSLSGSSIEKMFGMNVEDVEKMCHHYLISLLWNLNYYHGAMRFNIGWYFGYHFGPLIVDLIAVAKSVTSSEDLQLQYTTHAVRSSVKFIHPIQQLLCVLPPQSSSLVPVRSVRKLMDDESVIADLFPRTAFLSRFGSNVEWGGTMLLPYFDVSRVIEATRGLVDEKHEDLKEEPHYAYDKDDDEISQDVQRKKYYDSIQKKLGTRRRSEKHASAPQQGDRRPGSARKRDVHPGATPSRDMRKSKPARTRPEPKKDTKAVDSLLASMM